jgi:hypothetical protein
MAETLATMKELFYLRRNPNGSIYCFCCSDKAIPITSGNSRIRYIEIPISCVKKVYGIKNMPTTNDGIVWPRPWPQ